MYDSTKREEGMMETAEREQENQKVIGSASSNFLKTYSSKLLLLVSK